MTYNLCVIQYSDSRFGANIAAKLTVHIRTHTHKQKQMHSRHLLSYIAFFGLNITLSNPFTLSPQVKKNADGST